MKAEQTRGLSAPMTDIESPEACAERCLPCQCHYGFRSRNLRDPSCPRHNFADDVADAIRARDAAVRREALRRDDAGWFVLEEDDDAWPVGTRITATVPALAGGSDA